MSLFDWIRFAFAILIVFVLPFYIIYKICSAIGDAFSGNHKKTLNQSFNQELYYYHLWDEIYHQCWNDKTLEFNWNIWFDRRDEIIWCGKEKVLRTIDNDIKGCGRLQIDHISALLAGTFNPDKNKAIFYRNQILKIENTIILNLGSMFSFSNGQVDHSITPAAVRRYRDALYKLIRGEISWTKSNVDAINRLGHDISFPNHS